MTCNLGFRVYGLGCRGSGFTDLGFRGLRVYGSGCILVLLFLGIGVGRFCWSNFFIYTWKDPQKGETPVYFLG